MLKIISTQLKVIPGKPAPLEEYVISSAVLLKNEPFSFQLVYSYDSPCQPVTLDIDSPLPAESWRIDCLPITYAANNFDEPGYVTNDPGIVPDLLEPRPLKPSISKYASDFFDAMYLENADYTLNASKELQSVLVTINPNGIELAAGKYKITVTLRELSDLTVIGHETLNLEIIDAALPEQDFYVTNWFHVDCLCDYYDCEPYSERFYELFKDYLRNMVKHRQNTLLIPAFTPALDTPIGHVRRNVQLVDIEEKNGDWSFDFSRLSRFMKTADEYGIQFFEHCHLFSQWGATKTPSIYDRSGKLLFGWDTDAAGPEYTKFIQAYLKAYIDFAHSQGYTDDRLIFHISDEPSQAMLEGYQNSYYTVADLLAPFQCIDALSELDYYRKGLVKVPVASVDHAKQFSEECDSFWLYYTCGPYAKMCTNRLITNTAARTRILGTQMYKYGAQGFLHWGYNYYYDRMSQGYIDPKVNPCGYKNLPGCSYLAYPEKNGAVPSLREIHMRECFDDLRALKLCEALTSRNEVEALMSQVLGAIDFTLIPEGNTMYLLNQLVKRTIQSNL